MNLFIWRWLQVARRSARSTIIWQKSGSPMAAAALGQQARPVMPAACYLSTTGFAVARTITSTRVVATADGVERRVRRVPMRAVAASKSAGRRIPSHWRCICRSWSLVVAPPTQRTARENAHRRSRPTLLHQNLELGASAAARKLGGRIHELQPTLLPGAASARPASASRPATFKSAGLESHELAKAGARTRRTSFREHFVERQPARLVAAGVRRASRRVRVASRRPPRKCCGAREQTSVQATPTAWPQLKSDGGS